MAACASAWLVVWMAECVVDWLVVLRCSGRVVVYGSFDIISKLARWAESKPAEVV